ncbi:hypothetical protein Tco_0819284 [Tanacetum coccineum]|uniref:Uncharacterized protein n=1 Tax=Tanacetum coccineum TaxID=301880 RepID=A0ABQ5A645_9ASTR
MKISTLKHRVTYDSIFNRLQKIVSQLAILGENISQEDLNLKFLRSLPSEWNTHVVVWRNKPDLDSMSFDDLYNNFKIVEQEVKKNVTSNSNSGSQNMAYLNGFKVEIGTTEYESKEVLLEKWEEDHYQWKCYMANDKSLPTTALMAAFSNSRRNFVPAAVLTKSGIVPVSAARPINTVAPKSFVNAAKTRYLNINSVNTPKGNRVTSAVGEQGFNVVRSLACWLWYALTANPTIYVSLIEQFWQTVTVDTINDGEKQLTVTVDGKTIAITEASVRRHLQLANANGISSLPNTEIFDQLTLMGYVSNDDKLTFQKVILQLQ